MIDAIDFLEKRTRLILTIAIMLLLGMLVALLVTFYQLLTPAGDIAPATDNELTWVRSMYGFGPAADQQLLSPSSVAIGPDGDVYATDPIRARVMVFRPDGTFRRIVHTGAGGTGRGNFIRPESIDVDSSGDLYIADSWARKVIVFDANGDFSREWAVPVQARGVHVAGDRVYVLDQGTVLTFEKDGTPLGSFGSRGAGPGQIDAYQGIVTRGERVYVADSYNKRLQSFSASGSVEWIVPIGDVGRRGPVRLTSKAGDSSGADTLRNHRWELPQDLVFDGRGRLVVVDAFNFELAVVDPKTGLVSHSYGEFGRLDGQFFYPTSVDYDPVRDWFAVADTQNNRVQIVRLPDSAKPSASMLWRAAASPYRFLILPMLMVGIAVVIGAILSRKILALRARERTGMTAK